MPPIRRLAAVFALCCLATLPVLPEARATANNHEDASEFLSSIRTRAVEQLSDPSLDDRQREQRFRGLLSEVFDVPTIGRFVLGPHWRRASPAQRRAFLEVFEETVVQRFLPVFSEYSGETIGFGQIREDGNNPGHLVVSSTVTPAAGESVRIDWRVREHEAGYQVLDVVAEGVSLALTLRQEYASVIRMNGGVDGLVELMRSKLLRSDSASR